MIDRLVHHAEIRSSKATATGSRTVTSADARPPRPPNRDKQPVAVDPTQARRSPLSGSDQAGRDPRPTESSRSGPFRRTPATTRRRARTALSSPAPATGHSRGPPTRRGTIQPAKPADFSTGLDSAMGFRVPCGRPQEAASRWEPRQQIPARPRSASMPTGMCQGRSDAGAADTSVRRSTPVEDRGNRYVRPEDVPLSRPHRHVVNDFDPA
jgi:hypothetical protein